MLNNIKGKQWWAVQGSNLWPLPCQGSDLVNSIAFSAPPDAAGHVSFTTSSYAPWATLSGERL